MKVGRDLGRQPLGYEAPRMASLVRPGRLPDQIVAAAARVDAE